MALSNWDTLAVTTAGDSCTGVFVSPLGVVVEFYKNWLYIRDDKAWRKGGDFVSPTVMHINHGSFTYLDVSIVAVRGPKNGIYAAVWATQYPPKPARETEYAPPVVTGMVGIGCSGYLNEVDLVLAKLGRKQEPDDLWMCGATDQYGHKTQHYITNMSGGEEIEHEGFDLETLWVGIEDSEVTFLRGMLAEHEADIPKELLALKLESALRVNQGDAFIAGALGLEIPATDPGKPTTPLIFGLPLPGSLGMEDEEGEESE